MELLKIDHIEKYYGSKSVLTKAIDDISLTVNEGECYRFMGFQRKDYEACVNVGQSKSNIYHQAGDSIVTTCLVGIFGELFGLDYEKTIQDYADGLHKEVAE